MQKTTTRKEGSEHTGRKSICRRDRCYLRQRNGYALVSWLVIVCVPTSRQLLLLLLLRLLYQMTTRAHHQKLPLIVEQVVKEVTVLKT